MAKLKIQIDDEGRLIIPDELKKRLGLKPGREIFAENGRDSLLLYAPAERLARIYVEPTNSCNLECATCIRNSWDEPIGHMTKETWQKILKVLDTSDPVPEVFFGGFGEPQSHPHILAMIREAKQRGARVEMITNGILLDEERAAALIRLDLDMLWVSIDGASPDSYEDVRLGNELPRIIENIKRLNQLKHSHRGPRPELGITFVAMERNIADLSKVLWLSYDLKASVFHVSNVLPHTDKMKEEILYQNAMARGTVRKGSLDFPRMDYSERTDAVFSDLLKRYELHEMAGNEFTAPRDSCAFIKKGSAAVRHDGKVSPCLPLLHSNTNYLKETTRTTEATFFGDLSERSLMEIWNDPEYLAFRKKVMDFDFSPCTTCTSCELAESNEEDCFGSEPVSCGGCLWAQGFIRCP